MTARHTISMFHRRLALLSGVMLFVVAVMTVQLVRLSVVQGAEHLARAERALRRRVLLPTYRGSILDREGRMLAIDRPGYALALAYDVITGDWVDEQARRQARNEAGPTRWRALDAAARDRAAERCREPWQQQGGMLLGAVCRLGEIDRAELERRLVVIRRDVEGLAKRVWAGQRRAEIARRGGADPDFVFRESPIREQTQAHVVLPSVSDEVAFAFSGFAADLPADFGVIFEIQDARRRDYRWRRSDVPIDRGSLPRPLASDTTITVPVNGVADHILGSMRAVQAEDVERRPHRTAGGGIDLGGYRNVADVAGAGGLERTFEDHLRGTRGLIHRQLDSGLDERIDPVPGRDLELTIDILLQARVQAVMSDEIGLTRVQPYHRNERLPPGRQLNAAAVVLEVETGEILAMVSIPTRAMGRRRAALDPARAATDHASVNRPADAIYPPGSIIKPLVLVAAVSEGLHDIGETIECTGHFFPNVTSHARCWIYRAKWGFATHGALAVEDALGKSCNIFFYTLADRLGMKTLTAWCRRFGLGAGAGHLLTDEGIAKIPAAVRRFETVSMGIGQGRGVTWTPLQAANAYATLARGGVFLEATIVAGTGPPGRARVPRDLGLDPRLVEAVLEGLRRAVSDGGTGHHISLDDLVREPIFNAEGVTVWGKTGTAQAPPLRDRDTNRDGVIDQEDDALTGLDHAWFVGLVGPHDTNLPMFAIAVIVEYGGSGGRVAGPIANQIIRALQHEGYLPDEPISTEGPDP